MKKFLCFLSVVLIIATAGCSTQTPKSSTNSTSIDPASNQQGQTNSSNVSSSNISSSSAVNPNDSPQIVNAVSNDLKVKYPDINVTNEWLGGKEETDRFVVLFGALKSDPKQGVAQVIEYTPDCSKVLNAYRFMEPGKHGTLKVVELGSKDIEMVVVDGDGNKQAFMTNVGFDVAKYY